VISTALLEHLRQAFPGAELDYLVGAAAAPLLAGHPAIHERIVFDPNRTLRMWGEIRARKFDWVVDLQGSLRTALLSRASGARARLGWRIGAWRVFYTRTHTRRGPVEYVARERARLLERAGVQVTGGRPRIYLSDDERTRGERDARSAGAVPDVARVGMLLSTREPAKDWAIDNFGGVARALVRDGVLPLIFQAPGDEALTARMRAMAPGVVVLPVLDLRRFLGVLSTCRLFVSGDTGPAHMADALDVPRVTIFGPTSPVSWMPALPTARAVSSAGARVVPLRDRARRLAAGEDFMRDITPEMVMSAVRELLAGPTPLGTYGSES
jgi:ADP-heptose:LPS heptosyltransferase